MLGLFEINQNGYHWKNYLSYHDAHSYRSLLFITHKVIVNRWLLVQQLNDLFE